MNFPGWVKICACICYWIGLSTTIIFTNKKIVNDLKFPVMTLILLHQLMSLVLSRVYCAYLSVPIPRITCYENVKSFFAVAMLFCVNMYFSNASYIFLSVALIQMIKAITPVLVLILSSCMGLETFRCRMLTIVLVITCGVVTSSMNDARFGTVRSTIGIILQSIAVLSESARLSISKLILDTHKQSPIATLNVMCRNAVPILVVGWCFTDGAGMLYGSPLQVSGVEPTFLMANCCLAFFLNGASMLLIRMTSALTLNVCGILKDFLIIGLSVGVEGEHVTAYQYIGFTISTAGICAYTAHRHYETKQKEDGDSTYALLSDSDEKSEEG